MNEELKSAEGNYDYGFASIVSEIMDRHDVSCPLETKACYTEINNAFDSKLKEKDNQINDLKNENSQLLFDTMKDESIGFQSEIIDLQKQLKEKEEEIDALNRLCSFKGKSIEGLMEELTKSNEMADRLADALDTIRFYVKDSSDSDFKKVLIALKEYQNSKK